MVKDDHTLLEEKPLEETEDENVVSEQENHIEPEDKTSTEVEMVNANATFQPVQKVQTNALHVFLIMA